VPPSGGGFVIGDSLRLFVENHNECAISICLLFRPYAEKTDVWLPARDLPLANDPYGGLENNMQTTTNNHTREKQVTRASDYMAIYPNMTEQIRIMNRDFHSLHKHEEIVLTIPTDKLPRVNTAQVGDNVQFMLLATTLKRVKRLKEVVHGQKKAKQKVAHCSFSVEIKERETEQAYKMASGLPLKTAHGAQAYFEAKRAAAATVKQLDEHEEEFLMMMQSPEEQIHFEQQTPIQLTNRASQVMTDREDQDEIQMIVNMNVHQLCPMMVDD